VLFCRIFFGRLATVFITTLLLLLLDVFSAHKSRHNYRNVAKMHNSLVHAWALEPVPFNTLQHYSLHFHFLRCNWGIYVIFNLCIILAQMFSYIVFRREMWFLALKSFWQKQIWGVPESVQASL
jgi:hypothetical protein